MASSSSSSRDDPKYNDVAVAIKQEYNNQTQEIMASSLSAMSFTMAGLVRVLYIDDNNILIVMMLSVLSLYSFLIVGATVTVLSTMGRRAMYTLVAKKLRIGVSMTSKDIINGTYETDYTKAYPILFLENPLLICANTSRFMARMFGQLIGMLVMTYLSDLSKLVLLSAFVMLQIATQASEASNAPPTPPPSPSVGRRAPRTDTELAAEITRLLDAYTVQVSNVVNHRNTDQQLGSAKKKLVDAMNSMGFE
jgi:hypothetical protein